MIRNLSNPNNFFILIRNWLFRPGGAYNCAIARIAIAVALWLTINHADMSKLAYEWEPWVAQAQGLGWSPKGLVMITDWLFGGIPPGWTYRLAYQISLVSIICMALGFLVPYSQIIATITTLYCVSVETSFGPYWSHGFNVVLLAALAFMFARSADVFSVDAVVRSYRGKSRPDRGNVYWWPVIFAELATCLFMFGAFFQKFRDGGFNWALSDNIRNSLGITWLQYRADPPALVEWIVSSPLIWETAGMAQLFMQCSTVLACFLISYPLLRFIFGAVFFFIDILALKYVFHFWHPFWVPLCFLSIDFEHFVKAWRIRREAPRTHCKNYTNFVSRLLHGSLQILFTRRAEEGLQRPPQFMVTVGVLSFGFVFFGYYAACLYWRLGESHLAYPFSSMGFYSETRAKPPYNQHGYWPIYTGRIDVYESGIAQEPVNFKQRFGLEDNIFRLSTIANLYTLHESVIERIKSGRYKLKDGGEFTERPDSGQRIYYRSGLMAVTPYPSKIDFVDLHMGLRAVQDEKGWRALTTKLSWDDVRKCYVIDVQTIGFKAPRFEVLARTQVREDPRLREPVPLAGIWEGSRFYVKNSGNSEFHYALIVVQDEQLGIKETYYGPDNFQTYR
jgi:hypothetical protein